MIVPEALAELGKIYEQRNLIYGDNYKKIGKVLQVLYPNGLALQCANDFNRFANFVHIITKITRYAEAFEKSGHKDTLDDISVYAQIQLELDNASKNRGKVSETYGD